MSSFQKKCYFQKAISKHENRSMKVISEMEKWTEQNNCHAKIRFIDFENYFACFSCPIFVAKIDTVFQKGKF